ncbi:hypothetical protein ACFGVR_09610 [Mucilaginibacter sp. AW1-3]
MEKDDTKKSWLSPEIFLISSNDIHAKNQGSNEAYYSKTVPTGGGKYKFYHSGISEGIGTAKLSSVLS